MRVGVLEGVRVGGLEGVRVGGLDGVRVGGLGKGYRVKVTVKEQFHSACPNQGTFKEQDIAWPFCIFLFR